MNVPLLGMLAIQTPAVFAGWLAVTVLGGTLVLWARVRYWRQRGVDVLDVEESF